MNLSGGTRRYSNPFKCMLKTYRSNLHIMPWGWGGKNIPTETKHKARRENMQAMHV